jgi:hypothetical protein
VTEGQLRNTSGTKTGKMPQKYQTLDVGYQNQSISRRTSTVSQKVGSHESRAV